MRTDTIEGFLSSLADRVPAPGGGATAALHAAQGAALVAMVARYSDGKKYAEHAHTITQVRDTADDLRTRALALAEQDAAAFGAVSRAYALPKSTDDEKQARSKAIRSALVEAGRVPARVVAVAKQVISLAVVVGRSTVVGKPVAQLLLRRNATVTVCHSRTEDLAQHTRTAEHLSPHTVVIDVGTNPTPDGGLVGDVDPRARVAALTPVPGGVGPVTTALLLRHTIDAASR